MFNTTADYYQLGCDTILRQLENMEKDRSVYYARAINISAKQTFFPGLDELSSEQNEFLRGAETVATKFLVERQIKFIPAVL